jgi:hypothetical protein
LGGATLTGRLSDCPECGFRAYVDRYDATEIAAIYSGYRDESYFRQRHRHEPWYTKSFNAAIGGPEEVLRRNQRLEQFLFRSGILPVSTSVLDWGGDRGQFIPASFRERFVYDISGIEPMADVVSIEASQLQTRPYDLVLLAHVLEHASNPVDLLREVLRVRTARLYVEVPFEPVQLLGAHTSPRYERWVKMAAASRIFPLLAFASVATKSMLRRLPPFGVLQQHEHLNFFTESTLGRMLQRVGCRVVESVNYRKYGDRGPIESIGVLAIPSDS